MSEATEVLDTPGVCPYCKCLTWKFSGGRVHQNDDEAVSCLKRLLHIGDEGDTRR